MKLTVGMAVYNDFPGVFFSVEALRLYHDLSDTEILVVDNAGDKRLKDWMDYWLKDLGRYVLAKEITGTSYPRDRVFREARGEYVICIDSHVLLAPGALDKLWQGNDLIHGPMLNDDMRTCILKMRPEWRAQMWGVWDDVIPVGLIPKEPFEIEMHGLGLFGCRKDAWLGFNPGFRGFGGEEGYIHEKYRAAGRKVLCLPWMKWVHRFGRSGNYSLDMGDRVRNYLLGFKELGKDPKPIYDHFGYQMVTRINEQCGGK